MLKVPTVAATGVVVMLNVAEVAPAATLTDAGTVAEGSPPESVTTAPALGALPFNVTVPFGLPPPITLAGLTVRDVSTAGLTVRMALPVVPLDVAEIVTSACAATGLDVTVNVFVVVPAATVTLAGTVAEAVSELASVTTVPPAGAACDSVTVPVEEAPPVTAAGFTATETATTTAWLSAGEVLGIWLASPPYSAVIE